MVLPEATVRAPLTFPDRIFAHDGYYYPQPWKVTKVVEQLGYTPADALYRASAGKQHAAQGLAVAAHYDSSASGVGKTEC
jgi:hypothetical protein